MQANAWMGPVKESVEGKAGECPRNPDFDMEGTQEPSQIFRGGFPADRADGTFAQQSGGIR